MPVLSRFSGLSRHVNPRMLRLARKRPPLAVVHHRGRRTGRSYDTPVQAYRTRTRLIIGLAYGHDPDWLLNVLAADGAEITRHRRRYVVSRPRRRGPEARADLPAPAGLMMRALGIVDFVEVDTSPVSDDLR